MLDLNNGYEALYLNGALVGERSDVPFGQSAIHDGSPTVVGTSFQITLPLTNTALFFRLKY